MESEIHQNALKYLPNLKISEPTFSEILKNISFPLEGESAQDCCLRIIKEMTMKISEEISREKSKEMPIELLKMSEETLKKKVSKEMLSRMVEGDPKEIYYKILIIKMYQRTIQLSSPDTIFEHCLQRDIVDGTATLEEKEFVYRIKKDRARFTAGMGKERISSCEFSDEFDEYFEMIKAEPIFSYTVSNDFCIEYYKKCRKK